MTYRDLRWHFTHTFTDDQLDCEVIIQQTDGGFFPVVLGFQDGDDFLDDNQPYLAARVFEEDE